MNGEIISRRQSAAFSYAEHYVPDRGYHVCSLCLLYKVNLRPAVILLGACMFRTDVAGERISQYICVSNRAAPL